RREPGVAERRGNLVEDAVRHRKAELRIDQRALGHGAERPDWCIDVEIDAPAIALAGDALAAHHERAVRHFQIMQAARARPVGPAHAGGAHLHPARSPRCLRLGDLAVGRPLAATPPRRAHFAPAVIYLALRAAWIARHTRSGVAGISTCVTPRS